MMMMTMPATIESSPDQARINPPIREALAPSATNTVEKPSTKHHGRTHHRALRGRYRFIIDDMLDGRAGQVHQIGGTKGSTHGDRKLTRPAISAAGIETS